MEQSASCDAAAPHCQTPGLDCGQGNGSRFDRRWVGRALRGEVLDVLNALCEGSGVTEDKDGDFLVDLGAPAVCARVVEEPGAIFVYRSLADDVPRTSAVDEFLHDQSKEFVVFRLIWENKAIFLRADLAAAPFSPGQLQRILEDFDIVAGEVAPLAQEWSILS